jgi:hypothetical protein
MCVAGCFLLSFCEVRVKLDLDKMQLFCSIDKMSSIDELDWKIVISKPLISDLDKTISQP